jgi:hypothetical protein
MKCDSSSTISSRLEDAAQDERRSAPFHEVQADETHLYQCEREHDDGDETRPLDSSSGRA